jgi:hypothetical protein
MVTLAKAIGAQPPLSTDDVQNINSLAVVAVEHAARRFNDLAIARAAKLSRHRPALRVSAELVHVCKNPLDDLAGGLRLV